MNLTTKTLEEQELIIKNALESYTTFIECIYANRQEKNVEKCDNEYHNMKILFLASIIKFCFGIACQ